MGDPRTKDEKSAPGGSLSGSSHPRRSEVTHHGQQTAFYGHPGSVRNLPTVALAQFDEDRMAESISNCQHCGCIIVILEMQHVQYTLLLLTATVLSISAHLGMSEIDKDPFISNELFRDTLMGCSVSSGLQ